jgi:hypothetical protein
MTAIEAAASTPPPGSVTDMEGLLREQIRRVCVACDPVIQRGYSQLIRGSPAPELVERHRRDLLWALRSARLYQRLTSAHDFGDRSLAEWLEAKLRQLEEHWKYIFERPSAQEAEELRETIQKTFPDKSRT